MTSSSFLMSTMLTCASHDGGFFDFLWFVFVLMGIRDVVWFSVFSKVMQNFVRRQDTPSRENHNTLSRLGPRWHLGEDWAKSEALKWKTPGTDNVAQLPKGRRAQATSGTLRSCPRGCSLRQSRTQSPPLTTHLGFTEQNMRRGNLKFNRLTNTVLSQMWA